MTFCKLDQRFTKKMFKTVSVNNHLNFDQFVIQYKACMTSEDFTFYSYTHFIIHL